MDQYVPQKTEKSVLNFFFNYSGIKMAYLNMKLYNIIYYIKRKVFIDKYYILYLKVLRVKPKNIENLTIYKILKKEYAY